jgi:TP901 family phage tail tape measure protein/lambda family phage tail tape measure protein
VSVVANVAINVDSRNAVSKLRQVQTQAQSTEKAFGALQSAIGALGVGFALTKVIADVKELDTNLRRLGTVGGNVAALDKGLGALSKNLDGVASKAELAAASYQALSAGFTDTASNLKVVEVATKAAVGGLVDVTSVVEVTTKTLNAYNMSGDQAIKVTDSISKAIEFGQVQWSDYTSQLGRVASIAAVAGVSLDEVNAFIAAATKNGATAEVAFTGLGSTLATILKPTKESADAAKTLGINWTLAGIRGEGFESLMGKLAKAMQENPVLATEMVGGQEAIRGAFAAAAKGGADYKMILEGLGGAAGKTDADFQTMKGSLENTLKALDTSFKNLSEALGTAFGPTVVIVVQDITKAVNGFADFMATVPQPVMDTAGALVKLIAQMLLLQKAIQAIIALRVAFIGAMVGMTGATVASGAAATTSAGAFALYTNNTRALQAQAATATPVLQGMLGTLKSLAAIGTIAILVNVAVTGMAAVYQAQAEIDRLRGVRTKGGAATAFGGSATTEQKKEQQAVLAAVKKERKSAEFKGLQAAAAAGVGKTFARQRADQLTEREASARAILALPTRGQVKPAATVPQTPSAVPALLGATAGGGGGGRGGASAIDKAARDAERAAEAAKQQLKAADDINFALRNQLAIAQEISPVNKRMVEYDVTKNEIAKEANELRALAKSADELTLINNNEQIRQKIAQVEYEREINDLLTARAILVADLLKAASMPTVFNPLETQNEALQEILDKYPAIGAAADAAATLATSGMAAMIDGTKSAQQVFADFLNSIANALMQTAAKMIAQYIAIGIARMFAGIGAPGGFAPSGPLDAVGSINPDVSSFFSPNANGNAFGANGIIPFAKGGIVNSPTLFPFAKGTGLMGEAGPEAIMPLQRGANGKLGVSASGSGGDINVVVNVDASGSSVEGNEQEGQQLGRVIAAAIQAEMIKQKRPGGLLA